MFIKDAWKDLKFWKISEAWFVTHDVIYHGECSMCTWENSEIYCFWIICLIDINYFQLVHVFFNAWVSLLISCLDDLSIDVSGVLKSPTIIVLLPISTLSVQFSHSVVSDSLQSHGCQASLSITNSQSLVKLMSILSVHRAIHPSHPLSSPSSSTFNLS